MIALFKKKVIVIPQKIEVSEAYTTCSELSMYNFVKVTLTGDYKYLIKTGNPDNLPETWLKIKDEYADLSKDNSQGYLLSLVVQIDTLDKKLIIIQGIVDQLSISKNDELITILQNDMLMPFAYEDLATDLNKTVLKAKFDLMNLRRLEAEYKQHIEDSKSDKESSEQDYEDQFIALSKWMAVKYTLRGTSVAEYIALINRFNIENKPK